MSKTTLKELCDEELDGKKANGGDPRYLTTVRNFVKQMRELGAEVVQVGRVCVDFRHPLPWSNVAPKRDKVERESQTGELVEIHDTEPPDPFETWFNSPPAPPPLKK